MTTLPVRETVTVKPSDFPEFLKKDFELVGAGCVKHFGHSSKLNALYLNAESNEWIAF